MRSERMQAIKVGEGKGFEVWAGPMSEARAVAPDVYVSLNGEAIPPLVEDRGLGLTAYDPRPKGVVIRWPKGGLPPLGKDFWRDLALRLMEAGGKVYIGCGTGEEPTSTALAILAYHMRLTERPIAWVREAYYVLAVRTDEYARYVVEMTGVDEGLGGIYSQEPAQIEVVDAPKLVAGGYAPASCAVLAAGTSCLEEESDEPVYMYGDHIPTVERALKMIAEERGLDGDFADRFVIEEYEDSISVRGLGGEVEIIPPHNGYTGWYVSLWGSGKMKTAASWLLSKNASLVAFVAMEAAIAELLEHLGLSGEDLPISYDDVFGLAMDEEGVFVGPYGEIYTPKEAADYIMKEAMGE